MRDPETAVKLNNYYNGPKITYHHTQNDWSNSNFDQTAHRNYSMETSNDGALYVDDYEDEIIIKKKLVFTFIIISSLAVLAMFFAINRNPPRGSIIYKNAIYIPKNKDQILGDMNRNQAHIGPDDSFKSYYR